LMMVTSRILRGLYRQRICSGPSIYSRLPILAVITYLIPDRHPWLKAAGADMYAPGRRLTRHRVHMV